MSRVSVIIPVFNTGEFLQECLDSVLDQTYKNIEIIIVNDGSIDNSKDVLERYASQDSRILCVHEREHKGVAASRNIGISHATGDYLFFLDSDDWLEVNAIELLVNHIDQNKIILGKMVKTSKSRQGMLAVDSNQSQQTDIDQEDEEEIIISPKYRIISPLNLLISTKFAKEHQLTFYEGVQHYCHYSFILPIMLTIDEIPKLKQCTYYKRKRNDPINNPSLSQTEREVKVSDYLKVNNYLKELYKQNERANEVIDYNFINYFNKSIISLVRDREQLDVFFDHLVEATNKLDLKVHKRARIIVKRELMLIKKENKSAFYKLIKFHDFYRKVKRSLTSRRKFYIFLYRQIFMKLPLKENQIVFESFLGKNYSCSPKYIYEHMLRENMNYKYIWIFNEKGKDIPGNAKQIKRFSLQYYYYLATSKYWVSNSRLPVFLNKRKGNVYLQTWHGTPLKKLVFDMDDIHSANPNYKSIFYKQSRRWDYLISPNEYSSKIFRRAFLFEKEMIEVGYPRNDILYHHKKDELIKQIKNQLNIPSNKKVILYAPTWRDDEFYAPGKYKFQLQLDLQLLKEHLGDDYVIILRMHYFIADHIETAGLDDFVMNLSHYDDIAELYLISDVLITDYSSVFFDYANLRRPILFFTYDLEKYRDTLRGFYIDIEEEVPGPILKTTDEIIDSIKNISEVNKLYKEKYNRFYEKYCQWDNGTASSQVIDIVFNEKKYTDS